MNTLTNITNIRLRIPSSLALCPYIVHRYLHIKKQPPELFYKKLKQKNHFFNKAITWAHNFVKRELQHRCFAVNFAKFLRTTFLKNADGNCILPQTDNHIKDTYSRNKQMLKVNDRNIRKRCKISTKLTLKTPELCQC